MHGKIVPGQLRSISPSAPAAQMTHQTQETSKAWPVRTVISRLRVIHRMRASRCQARFYRTHLQCGGGVRRKSTDLSKVKICVQHHQVLAYDSVEQQPEDPDKPIGSDCHANIILRNPCTQIPSHARKSERTQTLLGCRRTDLADRGTELHDPKTRNIPFGLGRSQILSTSAKGRRHAATNVVSSRNGSIGAAVTSQGVQRRCRLQVGMGRCKWEWAAGWPMQTFRAVRRADLVANVHAVVVGTVKYPGQALWAVNFIIITWKEHGA